jgi:hypothetical protein
MEDILINNSAKESNFEYDVPSWAAAFLRPEKALYDFKRRKIQYNQKIYDPYWCTWYGAATFIANLRWIDWTKEDWNWFRDSAPSYWWSAGSWMYTSKAWDMIVKRLNMKFPEQRWVKESIDTYWSEDILGLLKVRWMLHMWSLINKKYLQDSQDDWVIEWPRWKWGEWHSRCFLYLWYGPGIVENYAKVDWVTTWLKYNIIDLKEFEKMLYERQFHNQVFIYYPTSKMKTPIPYPHMTVEQADALEKISKSVIPGLVSEDLSETVRAWIEAAEAWLFKQTDDKTQVRYLFRKYNGLDGVWKMTLDLAQIR